MPTLDPGLPPRLATEEMHGKPKGRHLVVLCHMLQTQTRGGEVLLDGFFNGARVLRPRLRGGGDRAVSSAEIGGGVTHV